MFFLFALACVDVDRSQPSLGDSDTDDFEDTDTDTDVDDEVPGDDDDDDPEAGALSTSSELRLPAVDVGQSTPDATLVLAADGLTEALTLITTGPFDVVGEVSAMSAGDDRTLTVTFTGSTGSPGNYAGTLEVSQGTQTLTVALAAVVVAPDLPVSLTWDDDGIGMSTFAAMPSAPYPDGSSTWNDPTVWIWVPHGLTAPFATVTHLHGFYATVSETIQSKNLAELIPASGRNAVFIVPQGPDYAASGDFGKLMDSGGHEALVRDSLAVAYRDGFVSIPDDDGVLLTSHSGGYRAVAAIIEHGGLPVDEVHLYDSLYGEVATYEDFALGGGVLRSNYTSSGGTLTENQGLSSTLKSSGLTVSDDFSDGTLRTADVTIGWTPATHNAAMSDERNYARWLVAALPPSSWAPPELLSVASDGTNAVVAWRDEGLDAVVEGSSDGTSWTELGQGSTPVSVSASSWIRLRYPDGDPSDAYPGADNDWLVVDGFDRILGGSWQDSTHEFGAMVGASMGASGASNEAVAEGLVDLDEYDAVIWLLGDESSADRTFTDAEQERIENYLSSGGKLVVSGSEVGFATSSTFLSSVLGCSYVKDDAGTTSAGGYTFGVAYPEDYPDVLSGPDVIWNYSTGGAAAVGDGDVVTVGFPLETLATADLPDALQDLSTYLSVP
jgi:hypothetical protein